MGAGNDCHASFCEMMSLSRPVCIREFAFQGSHCQLVVLGGSAQHAVAHMRVFERFGEPSALFGAVAASSTIGKLGVAHEDHAKRRLRKKTTPPWGAGGLGATAGRFNKTSNSLPAHSFHSGFGVPGLKSRPDGKSEAG